MKDFNVHITSFQEGDRQAFKCAFDSLYGPLCLFINRFIHHLPAAEDIVQESFLTLWNHHEEMTSAAHIKSFLYLTSRNTALDYLKHEKIRNSYNEQAIIELSETENFTYFVIEEEVEYILLKTQENLPRQCKQIFILAMQGKSNEDIAKQLDISVNTVKTQKKIAYKKMKQYISGIGVMVMMIGREVVEAMNQ